MSSFKLELIENKAYIGGKFIETRESFEVKNPYTMKAFSAVGNCYMKEAEQALQAADRAFQDWKKTTPKQRAEKLRSWASLVRENAEAIASLLTKEQGKAYGEALGEVMQGAVMIDWFSEEARRIHGETLCGRGDQKRDFTLRTPVGVVFAITPWNFPFIAPIVKCASAIAAGCTVILKPSEETPLVAMALAYCADKAGLNDGQFSVLPCANPVELSDHLMASPKVRMLSFTGSTNVGKKLYKSAADTMKKTAFELGGNAPFIVFDDADLDLATTCAKGARFYNNGQICIGANRIFVHENVYDRFVELYKEKVKKIKTGDGLDESTNTGPLINRDSLDKLEYLVGDALEKGASLVCGGKSSHGLNFEPTILRDMTREMDAYDMELFGPVACLYKFKTEDEVVRLANETPYGLAAYVFSKDHSRLWRLGETIEAGMIGANTTDVTSEDLPFGGIKQSGFGREGGMNCLEEYLEQKVFCLGL